MKGWVPSLDDEITLKDVYKFPTKENVDGQSDNEGRKAERIVVKNLEKALKDLLQNKQEDQQDCLQHFFLIFEQVVINIHSCQNTGTIGDFDAVVLYHCRPEREAGLVNFKV